MGSLFLGLPLLFLSVCLWTSVRWGALLVIRQCVYGGKTISELTSDIFVVPPKTYHWRIDSEARP